MTYANGDRVIAYDPRVWYEIGHDVGNNDHCWLPATVTNVYEGAVGGGLMADLLFDHNPDESEGHFADGPCCAIRGRIEAHRSKEGAKDGE